MQKFIKLFPKVRQYQPWNETNRGNVAHLFSSPSAMQSAEYYKALRSVCHGCTLTGLDILDGPSVSPSLRYVAQFKHDISRLKVPMPQLWGLHNYSDTNRFQSTRTRAILAALPGQVWLTETGGIVKFGGAFPNKKGSGLERAAKALSFMFKLASSNSRIKRLYIFQWSGATRWPTDPHSTGAVKPELRPARPPASTRKFTIIRYFRALGGNPRPGYVGAVVLAKRSRVQSRPSAA